MLDERRKTYNKAHYEKTRLQNQRLAEFKRLHPERFAELMKQAQTEVAEEATRPLVRKQTSYATTPSIVISDEEVARKTRQINEMILASRAGKKSYFIDVEIPHVGYIEEHTYFVNLYSPDEAQALYPNAKVTRVIACTCPLCQ